MTPTHSITDQLSITLTHQVSFGSDLQPEGDVALADGLDQRPVRVAHADLLALPPVVAVQHVRRPVLDYLRSMIGS